WLVVQGNKVMPGVLDHYAARTGWSSQQMAGHPIAPRPGNLDAAVDDAPGTDHGAHGSFSERAHGMRDRRFIELVGHISRELVGSVRDRAAEVTRSRKLSHVRRR